MIAAAVNDMVVVYRWKLVGCGYSDECDRYMKEIEAKGSVSWRWSKCQSGVQGATRFKELGLNSYQGINVSVMNQNSGGHGSMILQQVWRRLEKPAIN